MEFRTLFVVSNIKVRQPQLVSLGVRSKRKNHCTTTMHKLDPVSVVSVVKQENSQTICSHNITKPDSTDPEFL